MNSIEETANEQTRNGKEEAKGKSLHFDGSLNVFTTISMAKK